MSRNELQPFRVLRRCASDFPVVIQPDPATAAVTQGRSGVAKHRVMTTLYWLTCPMLVRHVSRFESGGWIRRLEQAVSENADWKEKIVDLHGEYAFRRRRAVGFSKMEKIRRSMPNVASSIEKTGIGGVGDTAHLKCLHAHAAYHLVRGGHPLFESFPELLTDMDHCGECRSLCSTATDKEDTHGV